MPSLNAKGKRRSGLIKRGGKRKRFLAESTLIKVDNVSWE
jgi:hypothetical protein